MKYRVKYVSSASMESLAMSCQLGVWYPSRLHLRKNIHPVFLGSLQNNNHTCTLC